MSARRPKPDSSVAGVGLDARCGAVAERRASASARLWPATAAVPWPITMHPPDRAVGAALGRSVGGQRVVAEQRHVERAVALDELAAQRLAERRRRLGDLLQQEVRGRRRGRCRGS